MSFQIARHFDQEKEELILKPKGELDIASTPEFKKVGEKEFNRHKSNIYIDAEDLVYMDSTGLGAFIYLLKLCQDQGKKVTIGRMKKSIRKLFSITKLDDLFEFEEPANEA